MSVPHRAAPPPPSRPGQCLVVKATYAYNAKRGDELSFDEGDVLFIIDKGHGGWWKARVGNVTGLIPSNYVEESTETVENPLHEAAKRGNICFLAECLSNNVSVNGLDKSGSTPLHWAAAGGHTDCVSELLSVPKVSINVQNKLGDTPLNNAAWKGHADVVTMLLEKGAVKDVKNKENKTAYDLARLPEVARLLKAPRNDGGDYGVDDEEDDE